MAQIFCPFCGAKNEESAAKCFICEKPFPWVGWSGGGKTTGRQRTRNGPQRALAPSASSDGVPTARLGDRLIAVILDSAVGLHQGGQVSAPVFRRITQQVLEYLHVPHDLPLAPKHQLLLAQAKVKDKDLDEGTPDHPGQPLETAEVNESAGEPVRPSVAQTFTPATARASSERPASTRRTGCRRSLH